MKLHKSDREDILAILKKYRINSSGLLFHKKKGRIIIKIPNENFSFSYFLKKSYSTDALGNKYSEPSHYEVGIGDEQLKLETWQEVLEHLVNYLNPS